MSLPTKLKCARAATVAVVLAAAWIVSAQVVGDPLERGFLDPPDSAKPRVWWHWMNGNITKEGIKADLEWMKRVGIGGFQNFDASISTPQIVDQRLIYMTPEWKDAFRYTATLADQLGLEMAIAGSPGWSETGGPWVTPAQAMKKFVWSETTVQGGHPFTGALPKPPATTGQFQNLPPARGNANAGTQSPEFYADSAVVAFPVPEGDVPMAELEPKVTASGGHFDLAALTDGDLATATLLPAAPAGQKAWIQFEFARPQAVRGLTLITTGGPRGPRGIGGPGQELESSADGRQFQSVTAIPVGARTIAFDPVPARFFRVTFLAQPAPATAAPTGTQVSEMVLHTGERVHRFEDKAGFTSATNLYALATPAMPADGSVRKGAVIDLTGKMRPDGTLDWTPPAGRWVILRFGYSLTGVRNSPASPEATGLEVDKLSREHVKAYMDNYLGQYKDTLGKLMGERGLRYVITDSWEAGTLNWTDNMFAEFAKRRGYDLHSWMPVLAGHVVESAEASDRVLWDLRKTIGELTAEYHYGQISASLKERGMGRYTESHETGRAFVADGMEVKRGADIPMSAMWTPRGPSDQQTVYSADIRESASVAHIYGQNLVAAESLTANGNAENAWIWSPETLKPTADRELANGLNRFVIHTSVHQPVTAKAPGLGLGHYGQWFTRLETWGELAKPWITYLSRSSYMLQQGKFVADVAYFYGEDSNITALFGAKLPDVPAGYNYDFVNSDALVHQLSVNGGHLVTATGMSYRVLALDANSVHMPLPVLRKIRDLVDAGAVVVGPKPIDSPSQSDDQGEFQSIANQLWAAGSAERIVGKGKVFAGKTIGEALAASQVTPDFEYTMPRPDTSLLFVHRAIPGGEVYWVNNRNNRAESVDATFRVAGKATEIWNPITGKISPATYRVSGGRTTVALRLDPADAVFVVFRKAGAPSRTVPVPVETALCTVDGAWDVAFQAGRGAPASVSLPKLASWTESSDLGVKYFSGTATYNRTLQAPADWFRTGTRLILDLGDTKNLAEVTLNGKPLGILWKTPFRVDVTGVLAPGANTLQVKVTNLWVNRLIGGLQPGAIKYTYTTHAFYRAESPLLPSGLLGPVRIVRSVTR